MVNYQWLVTMTLSFYWRIYCTFIDADDLWTSDKLELQLAALQQQKNEVAYVDCFLIGENGQFLCAQNPHFLRYLPQVVDY